MYVLIEFLNVAQNDINSCFRVPAKCAMKIERRKKQLALDISLEERKERVRHRMEKK